MQYKFQYNYATSEHIVDMHWETQLTQNMQIQFFKKGYTILDDHKNSILYFLVITSPAQNLLNWLVARCVGIYQRHRQYSKCHTRSSLPSPEYEHIDKHERKAVLIRQHATDTACTLVINWLYLATNQLKHCSQSYTTGIIELSLRS